MTQLFKDKGFQFCLPEAKLLSSLKPYQMRRGRMGFMECPNTTLSVCVSVYVCGGGGGRGRQEHPMLQGPLGTGEIQHAALCSHTRLSPKSCPELSPPFVVILLTPQRLSCAPAHLSHLDPGTRGTSASLGFQDHSSRHYPNSVEYGLSPALGTPSTSEVTHGGALVRQSQAGSSQAQACRGLGMFSWPEGEEVVWS